MGEAVGSEHVKFKAAFRLSLEGAMRFHILAKLIAACLKEIEKAVALS